MRGDCDFIPSSYREARGLHAALRARVACVVILVAVMGSAAFFHRGQLAAARGMIAEVGEQQAQIDLLLGRKAEMEAEHAALLNFEQLVRTLDDDVDFVAVFADLTRRMPPTTALTELKATSYPWGLPDDPRPEPPMPPPPPALGGSAPPRRETAPPPMRAEEVAGDRLVLMGVAASIPEIISFARDLEGSPYLTSVQMEILEQTEWLGRKAQQFRISCGLRRSPGGSP